VALLLLLATAGGGRADFILDLGNPNIAGNSSVTSPYADLKITGDVTTGKLIFNITLAGTNSGKATFGAFGFDFNQALVNASDFTVKVTGTGGSTALWGAMGSGDLDGFGRFDEVIGPSSNGLANRLTSVNIELDFKAGKFDEALVSNFVVANAGGANGPAFDFAEEFFPNTGATGFIGVALPEPTPLVLLASGGVCLAVVLVLRRRKPTVA
jgi:hypothetical protein